MNKTITVEVEGYKTVPRYGKTVRRTKKFHAHDETNQCEAGDVVRLKEVPRMSKSKTMVLDEVLRKVVKL
jgi:small subunit ribosomal protein S17